MAESIGRDCGIASGPIMIETPTLTAAPGMILLGAYAARSCPVKTQNAFNPTVGMETAARDSMENNEGLAELFDGGGHFKTAVIEQLINSCVSPVVDLRPLSDCTRSEQIEACVRAMTSGADVIIGGCLPVDSEGHRVGYPDLLVRGADRVDDSATYHPVEVKWHKIIERAQPPHDATEPRTTSPLPARRTASQAMDSVSGAGPLIFFSLPTTTACSRPVASDLDKRWSA